MIYWLERLPSTNARIVVALLLDTITGGVVLACLVLQIQVQQAALDSWLTFLAIVNGVSAGQFAAKRMTFKKAADPDGSSG